ncbi:MAG: CHASE3 domain-containing protein, partial [Gemmatimonadaceae bacterium]|nr:CHASE3 domain-containing protein [Gemmatimonadaceae bacterium]
MTRKSWLSAERLLEITLILTLSAAAAAIYYDRRTILELVDASRDVAHTQEVMTTSKAILADFLEAQGDRRAFLLSGDHGFLATSEESRSRAQAGVGLVARMTRNRPVQQARIDTLSQLLEQMDRIGAASVTLRREQGLEAAGRAVASREAQVIITGVGTLIDRFEQEERRLLASRTDRLDSLVELSRRVVILSSIFALFIIVAATILIRADLSERRDARHRLTLALRDAEVAAQAKSDFLANMSHEIRTPLNGVLGMTELLYDSPLDTRQREYLDMVRTSAETLLHVVNDILDFSKIEAGKMSLETMPFLLRDTVGDTVRALAIRARMKGLEISFRARPDVPDAFNGDPARLRQVLVNLISNAIKFTREGEIVVELSVGRVTPDDATVRIDVRDTGIGISPERQAAIFQAFTQADT